MSTFIVAEIAQAHDGSLGILHSYIDALATLGVDAVKFQTHIAEAESSIHEPFRVRFSRVDKTRYDYWKRMEFSPSEWAEIKAHCDNVGVEFMSSPFSIKAVEILESIQMVRYKIASGEINNLVLLERIAQTGKPVILSSGMSDLSEIERAVNFFKLRGVDVSVLQCTTMYPTPPEKLGLNVIPILKERFNVKVGFSDHSGDVTPCLAAKALGADILEFHAVFDKRMFGPDTTSSLTLEQIDQLVKGVRYLEKALDSPVDKTEATAFSETKKIFGKSLAVSEDLPPGHVLSFQDLETKKPAGFGIPPSEYINIIGRKLNKPLSKYSFLRYEDLFNE